MSLLRVDILDLYGIAGRILFSKYPQLKQLEDRSLFLSGKMLGAYGIVWSDELDIETETIYEDGETVRHEKPIVHQESAHAVAAARAIAGISQKQLDSLKENCESSRNCCGE